MLNNAQTTYLTGLYTECGTLPGLYSSLIS
jgi:hypothetical protein